MRTSFLVDGFNLYHSLIDVEKITQKKVKWLDIFSLCKSYLPNLSTSAKIEKVIYFSAYAKHRVSKDPNVINRHKIYIEALEHSGVDVILGHFKSKKMACPHCHKSITKYEEKETDVSIAVKIFELFHQNMSDHIVLITGDTDLVPAVKVANQLFGKDISVIYPYNRVNAAYKSIVQKSIKITADRYLQFQFPSEIKISAKRSIHKPNTW